MVRFDRVHTVGRIAKVFLFTLCLPPPASSPSSYYFSYILSLVIFVNKNSISLLLNLLFFVKGLVNLETILIHWLWLGSHTCWEWKAWVVHIKSQARISYDFLVCLWFTQKDQSRVTEVLGGKVGNWYPISSNHQCFCSTVLLVSCCENCWDSRPAGEWLLRALGRVSAPGLLQT